MLNSQLMDQLLMIQAKVSSVSSQEYQATVSNMGCGNGPTNCQNQW